MLLQNARVHGALGQASKQNDHRSRALQGPSIQQKKHGGLLVCLILPPPTAANTPSFVFSLACRKLRFGLPGPRARAGPSFAAPCRSTSSTPRRCRPLAGSPRPSNPRRRALRSLLACVVFGFGLFFVKERNGDYTHYIYIYMCVCVSVQFPQPEAK